jgi:SAM-dependent methyltransferase
MVCSDDQARGVLDQWRESAALWQKHAATVREMFEPITGALVRAAGISEGYGVLDVAGGTGEPSLSIARIVGPLGAVMCTDAALEMVSAAEHESRRLQIGNVAFHQALADSLPFDDNSFDAVVCRLGAMFFPDTRASLEEMLRVARPGARIALAVWSGIEKNPFFEVALRKLSALIPAVPKDDDAPGAFRYSRVGKLSGLLTAAGGTEVQENFFRFYMQAPVALRDFWGLKVDLSDSMRSALASLSAEQGAELAASVSSELGPYFSTGRMRIPAQVLIVSARKVGQRSLTGPEQI